MRPEQEQTRIKRSFEIQVLKQNQWLYQAVNLRNGHKHNVWVQDTTMVCECKDAQHRAMNCKHIYAVARFLSAENMMHMPGEVV